MGDAWIGPRFFQPELAVRVARQQNDYLVALIGMLNRISARRLGCARVCTAIRKANSLVCSKCTALSLS